jgi:uncharacterized protein YlxW (UPF0749 family)
VGEAATLYALAIAVLTTFGNAWSRRESRLEKQIEVDNDAEKLTLRAEVKNCDEDRAQLRTEFDEMKKELRSLRDTLMDRSSTHHTPIRTEN